MRCLLYLMQSNFQKGSITNRTIFKVVFVCRRNPEGWFPKRWFWRMFPRNENRNEGTFGCSPGTKTGTRVRSHVPPERRPERGYIRQSRPFTKLPFCLQVSMFLYVMLTILWYALLICIPYKGVCKRWVCCNAFMKVCVEQMRMR